MPFEQLPFLSSLILRCHESTDDPRVLLGAPGHQTPLPSCGELPWQSNVQRAAGNSFFLSGLRLPHGHGLSANLHRLLLLLL